MKRPVAPLSMAIPLLLFFACATEPQETAAPMERAGAEPSREAAIEAFVEESQLSAEDRRLLLSREVQVGWSPAQVRAALGPPRQTFNYQPRPRRRNVEVWHYGEGPLESIWFECGKVTSVRRR
jgi:hypothetical protein